MTFLMSLLNSYFSVINIFSNILSFVMPNPALQKISEYVCYLQREQEFDLCDLAIQLTD